jgi:hypothetical protein
MTQKRREERSEDSPDTDRLGGCDIGGKQRQCSPAEREPQVAVEPSAEQLQVVGHGDECARRDEGQQPRRRVHRGHDADRRRCDQRHRCEHVQRPAPDPCRQRPALRLVQSVRSDAHAEEKREQRKA